MTERTEEICMKKHFRTFSSKLGQFRTKIENPERQFRILGHCGRPAIVLYLDMKYTSMNQQ